MIELIKEPWHWTLSGAMIAVILFLMLFFGKAFGFSSNFKIICSACGAGFNINYFKYDWKSQIWNLVFLVGSVIGGYIANKYLSSDTPVQLTESTIQDLKALGFSEPSGMQPEELFSTEKAFTLKGFLLLALGGLAIGFGTRYAEGCTSGHGISGLSNLQLPSLIAVIGFFIGGWIMTFFLFPFIF